MSEKKKTEYEVGYGKPPKHSRFKKGQSGNPKGRPKGAKGVRASLKRELESKITIREENREMRVSKSEAMAKRIMASALKGELKTQLALLKIDAELFTDSADKGSDSEQSVAPDPVEYEILRDFFASKSETEDGVENEEEGSDDDN